MEEFSRKTDADPSEPGFFRGLFDQTRRASVDRWLADCGRFWWALIALNLRKTLFAARGRSGRWPCQSPSDSGLAWETTCEARALWNSPARFRRVCPILKKAPDGRWVCSVDTADVRPFWGRAAAWFGGAAIVLFVAGTILAFGYLRIVGYPVRLGSVAWPPSWHEVREARASYLFQKAELSLHADSDSPPAKK